MKLDMRRETSNFEVDEVDPISKACQEYLTEEKEVDDLEILLKTKKESLRGRGEHIVQLMEERGVTSIKMKQGQSVEIKPFYTGSISKDKQEEAFQWLRDKGYDDLIKNQVVIKFGRAEDEKANKLFTDLANQGLDTDRSVKVEPMTLKGFIREMIESGKELPMDTFGVFVGHKINIKKAK
tara:strand:- start:72 stop:614 length:543 start_codon:yes stop_codon:yes gene_type:complete